MVEVEYIWTCNEGLSPMDQCVTVFSINEKLNKCLQNINYYCAILLDEYCINVWTRKGFILVFDDIQDALIFKLKWCNNV